MVSEFGMGVALDADGAPPIALPTGDYALSDRTRRDVDMAAMTLAREALPPGAGAARRQPRAASTTSPPTRSSARR